MATLLQILKIQIKSQHHQAATVESLRKTFNPYQLSCILS